MRWFGITAAHYWRCRLDKAYIFIRAHQGYTIKLLLHFQIPILKCRHSTMASSDQRTLVSDVNDHILCRLCRGYLIDATTLTQCLHSCNYILFVWINVHIFPGSMHACFRILRLMQNIWDLNMRVTVCSPFFLYSGIRRPIFGMVRSMYVELYQVIACILPRPV